MLVGAAVATAQNYGMTAASRSAADTVLLSERIDGDYQIRKSLVSRPADAGYHVLYVINQSTLSPSFEGNQNRLTDMQNFVNELERDTLMKLRTVTITGYASPDGPRALNTTLAANRARNFRNYADKQYNMTKRCAAVECKSVASDWSACRAAVAQSNIPEKQTVLQIIDSNDAPMEKEARMKAIPGVWDYMKTQILPPMRRVEVSIDYADNKIVETRTMIARPAPKPVETLIVEEVVEQPCPCPCDMIDEQINGIIIEMDDPDLPR